MLKSPFPKNVSFAEVLSGEESQNTIHPEEEKIIADFRSIYAKDNFIRGRIAAKKALEGIGQKSVAILRGSSGEPLWPKGIVGSIAHIEKVAVAAVAKQSDYLSLGVDIEEVRKISRDISKRIALPSEHQWVAEKKEEELIRTLILFSAKESAFKALFPLCKRHIGFHEVLLTRLRPFSFKPTINDLKGYDVVNHDVAGSRQRIGEVGLTWSGGSFKAKSCGAISEQIPEGFEFIVECHAIEDLVLTGAVIPLNKC